MWHILTADYFTKQQIDKIFFHANAIKEYPKWFNQKLTGKVLGSLFFEPSTRTRWSFEAAMLKLGGNCLTESQAKENSSIKKGESLEDTLKTCSQYTDVLVVRHPKSDLISQAAKYSNVPVINGGDGCNEHPTQALLDLYTITQHFQTLNNLSILFTGDLVYSRTIRSLVKLLPKGIRIIKAVCNETHSQEDGLIIPEEEIVSYLPHIDIIYMTRNQSERQSEGYKASSFILTNEMANRMKNDAIIMHPLPRNNEIDKKVDENHRAKYFLQAKNGLWVRMGLLYEMLRN